MQRAVAAVFFEIHQLAVAGHAVGDPRIVEGFRADLGAPPLVGDGVGKEADAGLVGDAGAHDTGQLGSPGSGKSVVGHFNDVEVRGFGGSEAVGEEVVFLRSGFSHLVASGLVADGEVDLDVAGSSREGAKVAAGDDGTGEARLIPVEVELVAGLAIGEGDGFGRALDAAGEDLHPLRHFDVELGSEAVGHEAGGGEPARSVEQVGNGFLNSGQLEAFNRAVFVAGDDAFVFECPMGGLARGEWLGRRDADGSVGEALAGEKLAGLVSDFGDFEGRMKAEADLVCAFRRGKGDLGLGRDVMRGGVELGIDDVAGDVEGGALRPLGRQVSGQDDGGEQRERAQKKARRTGRLGQSGQFDFELSQGHIVFSCLGHFRQRRLGSGWHGLGNRGSDAENLEGDGGYPVDRAVCFSLAARACAEQRAYALELLHHGLPGWAVG